MRFEPTYVKTPATVRFLGDVGAGQNPYVPTNGQVDNLPAVLGTLHSGGPFDQGRPATLKRGPSSRTKFQHLRVVIIHKARVARRSIRLFEGRPLPCMSFVHQPLHRRQLTHSSTTCLCDDRRTNRLEKQLVKNPSHLLLVHLQMQCVGLRGEA